MTYTARNYGSAQWRSKVDQRYPDGAWCIHNCVATTNGFLLCGVVVCFFRCVRTGHETWLHAIYRERLFGAARAFWPACQGKAGLSRSKKQKNLREAACDLKINVIPTDLASQPPSPSMISIGPSQLRRLASVRGGRWGQRIRPRHPSASAIVPACTNKSGRPIETAMRHSLNCSISPPALLGKLWLSPVLYCVQIKCYWYISCQPRHLLDPMVIARAQWSCEATDILCHWLQPNQSQCRGICRSSWDDGADSRTYKRYIRPPYYCPRHSETLRESQCSPGSQVFTPLQASASFPLH